MHIKRFLEWIGLKEELDAKQSKVPHVSQGQIWWASLGENVGFEVCGKGKNFVRPVLIFKKLSSHFYFVIPLTTQIKTGSWYLNYKQDQRVITACLHQARPIDYRRLHNKLGTIDEADFLRIQLAFQELYIEIVPIISDGVAGNP